MCRANTKSPEGKKPYYSSRDRAIILVLLDTGIWVSELCGISVKDIDLESGRILVNGKGNKYRFVYLGKISKQAVWSYLVERFSSQTPPQEEPVFMDRNQLHRITSQGILLLLKRLGRKARVNNVHPHKFRHTFAVEFLRNGGNVFKLQQLLGHTDLEMSRKYVELAQIDLESTARRTSPADRMRLK